MWGCGSGFGDAREDSLQESVCEGEAVGEGGEDREEEGRGDARGSGVSQLAGEAVTGAYSADVETQEDEGMTVVSLDDHRPHFTLQTLDGNVHVFPRAMIEDVISGKLRIVDIDDYEIILRTILKDWLENL